MNRTEYRKRLYQKHLNEGKCPLCGGRRDNEGILCTRHRQYRKLQNRKVTKEQRRQYQANYRQARRREKTCPWCGRELDGIHKMCSHCRKYRSNLWHNNKLHRVRRKKTLARYEARKNLAKQTTPQIRVFKGDKWNKLLGTRIPFGSKIIVLRYYPRRRILVEYKGEKMTTMLWCLERRAK